MALSGICDTHMHFYDDRYPVAAAASLRPPNALVGDYRKVQEELGLERAVVVQPTTYGMDNRCQLDAMAAMGPAVRGIVVIDSTVSDAELRAFTLAGVCGARFHMLSGGAVGWEQLESVAGRIGSFGWHVQLQLNGHELVHRKEQLLRVPCPLVIDHIGRFMPPATPDSAEFCALLDLVDAGAYVKLSAPYESAADPTQIYSALEACIQTLTSHEPGRLLWASNWPHPGQVNPPSNSDLGRLRDHWLPDHVLRNTILVANPAELYGF